MFAAKDRLQHNAAASSRPVTLAAPARISDNLRRESQNRPFLFNRLRTLWPPQNPLAAYFQSPAPSLAHKQNITTAFPTTSALFVLSFAQERKSTPLLSSACAQFCGKWGYRENLVRKLDCQYSLLPRVWTALAAHARKVRAVLAARSQRNPNKMNTYAKRAAKPRRMCTYKIIRLKASYNEHLQKNGGRGELIVTQPKTGNEEAISVIRTSI
jgi:hypothetical protein